jgi:hypothetical protein
VARLSLPFRPGWYSPTRRRKRLLHNLIDLQHGVCDGLRELARRVLLLSVKTIGKRLLYRARRDGKSCGNGEADAFSEG